MWSYLTYALWTDLKRPSTWALILSMVVIAVSISLCTVLFSVASAIDAVVEADIIRSGAVNSMDVAARPDREYQKPWAAPPIATDNPTEALGRLLALLPTDLDDPEAFTWRPAWLSPGWVYMFLTRPGDGGTPVAVGVSLTSATDPERSRIDAGRLAGHWIDSGASPQVVLPRKIADRLWPGVLFVGETAWLGITETSTCVEVTVAGIFEQTQRDYCYANEPVVLAVQSALAAMQNTGSAAEPVAQPEALAYDRVRMDFDDRATLIEARHLVEERYKFWASTPYDRFEGKLRLAAAVRASAWVVFTITLTAACGSVFCTFLAWVSRRRYEIALLKAQGSGNAWVAGLYTVQSGVAGLVAGGIGVALGSRLCPLLAEFVTARLDLKEALQLTTPAAIGAALVAAAVAMSVAAALPPARIAAQQDPWEILREAI